jgi:hypothetical protein
LPPFSRPQDEDVNEDEDEDVSDDKDEDVVDDKDEDVADDEDEDVSDDNDEDVGGDKDDVDDEDAVRLNPMLDNELWQQFVQSGSKCIIAAYLRSQSAYAMSPSVGGASLALFPNTRGRQHLFSLPLAIVVDILFDRV